MAVELATGYISLVPSARGIATGIEKEMGAPLAAAARTSGARASGSFVGSFKGGMAGLGKAFLGIAGLATGIGVGLVATGKKFEDAFNTIERGTGATGKTLEGLDKSFKTVLAGGAGTFEQVSLAVTKLFQRTGLTGKALDDFAAKQVRLARITKTDVAANLEATTGLFNLYGIAAGSQSKKLDLLFRASQVAGVSVTQLASDMQAAAPTAKILGLSIDQTAGLVANLDRAGLPASKVMLGLAGAFAKAAKAGKEPLDVVHDLTEEIKAAPNATVAATIAVQKFGIGARQAATLVAGIRSGAIQLDKSLAAGKGINATAKSTATLSGAFAHLKNVALVGLEPLATKALGAFAVAIEFISPFVGKFFGWFGTELPKIFKRLAPTFRTIQLGIGAFKAAFSGGGITSDGFVGAMEHIGEAARAALTTLIDVGKKITKALQGAFAWLLEHRDVLRAVIVGLGAVLVTMFAVWTAGAVAAAVATIAAALPFIALVAAIAVVSAAIFFAFERFKPFHDIVIAIGKAISQVDWAEVFTRIGNAIRAAFTQPAIKRFVVTLRAAFDAVVAITRVAIGIVVGVVTLGVKLIQNLWDRFGHTLLDKIRIAFNAVALVFNGALQVIQGILEVVTGILTLKWATVWQGFQDIFGGAWAAIVGTLQFFVNLISAQIGSAVAIISAVWDAAWDRLRRVVSTVFDGILGFVTRWWPVLLAALTGGLSIVVALFVSHFDQIVGFFASLPGRILGFAASIGNAALAIGKAIIDGIKDGITSAEGFVGDIASAFVDAIKEGWNTVARDINDFLPNSIGKGPFRINLPDNPIPTFAQGGVVSGPTLGILGENTRTTPEIVSPVKLMAKTFKAELARAGTGTIDARIIVQGNVNGVDDLDAWADRRDQKLKMALDVGHR